MAELNRNPTAQQSSPLDLSERLAEAVEALLAHVHASMLAEWREHELTVLQAWILETLLQTGSARVTALAANMGHSVSATSSLVDRLVEKGMIDRRPAPNDRRVVVCELTPLGRNVAGRNSFRTHETLQRIAQQANEEQLAAIVEGLEELVRQIHVDR